jgi:hypothetical protein
MTVSSDGAEEKMAAYVPVPVLILVVNQLAPVYAKMAYVRRGRRLREIRCVLVTGVQIVALVMVKALGRWRGPAMGRRHKEKPVLVFCVQVMQEVVDLLVGRGRRARARATTVDGAEQLVLVDVVFVAIFLCRYGGGKGISPSPVWSVQRGWQDASALVGGRFIELRGQQIVGRECRRRRRGGALPLEHGVLCAGWRFEQRCRWWWSAGKKWFARTRVPKCVSVGQDKDCSNRKTNNGALTT